MDRLADNRADWPAFNKTPGIHDRNAIGDFTGHAHVMGHE